MNARIRTVRAAGGEITDEDVVDSHFAWNRPRAYGVEFDYVQLHRAGTPDIVEGKRFYQNNPLYSPPLLKLHGSLNWFVYSGTMIAEGLENMRIVLRPLGSVRGVPGNRHPYRDMSIARSSGRVPAPVCAAATSAFEFAAGLIRLFLVIRHWFFHPSESPLLHRQVHLIVINPICTH